MSSKSPILTFVAVVAALLLGAAIIVFILPVLASVATGAAAVLLGILPLVFTIWALYSCVTSSKPTSTILLWIIIIVLAPFFGPLLWFLWGRSNT